MKACVVVPVYDQPERLGWLFDRLEPSGHPVVVVDDGSGRETRDALERALAGRPRVTALRHETNLGKGAALRTGFAWAASQGYSHALQIDADGQHDPADGQRMIERASERQDAAVLGAPHFGPDAPLARRVGRKLSTFWVHVECGSRQVADPLCGLRCLPLEPVMRVLAREPCGDRMDFDPELAVRLVWEGVPIENLAVPVRYPEGGRSHFRMFADNVAITRMHTRLVFGALRRVGSRSGGGA